MSVEATKLTLSLIHSLIHSINQGEYRIQLIIFQLSIHHLFIFHLDISQVVTFRVGITQLVIY